MTTFKDRLVALRRELKHRNIEGFVIPLTDEHLSENVGSYAERLKWLSGFTGSSATAVVLGSKAAIFVDGRYKLQVREQVDGRLWHYVDLPAGSVGEWLRENSPEGGWIGYDPWLHTAEWVTAMQQSLGATGRSLVALSNNPIDAIWHDRPALPQFSISPHPLEFAGITSQEKRRAVAARITDAGANALVVTALDDLAWLFNIRGADIARTPVALGYAVLYADGSAELFVAPEKLSDCVRSHLGDDIALLPYERFADRLETLACARVAVDPHKSVEAIESALRRGGAAVVPVKNVIADIKTIKNPVEIAGQKAAHARDGAALTRFLHWLSLEAPSGTIDEFAAATRLEAFRAEAGQLKDLSFDTISSAGPNGALVHYSATVETSQPLTSGSLYLVDSGAQYEDGTTDVTRTVAIGAPTAEMMDRFTRVLKGHIAMATALFPAGTCGGQLDILARQYLWSAGLDYAHGTGHGVGSFLSVHEGPQRIAPPGGSYAGWDVPLRPGMILSNEPGYYKTGAYGIRIENLVLVTERSVEGAEIELLGFETLTLAPIDRNLILCDQLDRHELEWIDAYHRRVVEIVGPQLDPQTCEWLREACAPLSA